MENIICPHCNKCCMCEFIEITNEDILFMGGDVTEKYKCGECNEYFYVKKTIEVTDVEIRKTK